MNLFSRPPVIGRTHTRGAFAEGVLDGDELTFEHAVGTLSFLVPKGQQMTGAQWIESIKKSYDVAEPRMAEVVRVIEKVMLVDQFKDDCVLVCSWSVPTFRGTKHECEEHAKKLGVTGASHVRPVKELLPSVVAGAELQMKIHSIPGSGGAVLKVQEDAEIRKEMISSGRACDLLPLGVPDDYLYVHNSDFFPVSDMVFRMRALLDVKPVGPDQFSAAQSQDRSANVSLMATLAQHLGYGALVTPGRLSSPRAGGDRKMSMLTTRDVEDSVASLFDSLVDSDWKPSSPVYLCRPAPVYNPLASIRPFESMVHEQLIGWRLPQGLVETFYEEALECRSQKDQVREHGERAA